MDALRQKIQQLVSRLKGDFQESDHPRADDGKFGSGGGGAGGGGGGKRPSAPRATATATDAEPAAIISPSESKALRLYSEEAHFTLNSKLRKGKPLGPKSERINRELQAAFAKTPPLPEPILVKRGLDLDAQSLGRLEKMLMDAQSTSSMIEMPGYTSTSTSPQIAKEFQGNVEIYIMANRGIDMRPHSAVPKENEFLLDHNTRFEPVGVRREGGKLIVQMRQA